ncbi:MAG: SIR2 family protein [Caldilineaceae bacterium]
MNTLIEPANQQVMLSRLLSSLRAGECILFLGAGVHTAPPDGSVFQYPKDRRPLLGRELAETLARECEYQKKFPDDKSPDLQRITLCYENTRGMGRMALVDALVRHLRISKTPSPALEMLAALPVKIFVTTNYDDLLERALRKLDKDPAVYVYDPKGDELTDDMAEPPMPEHPLLFKMHGDLGHPNSIVITDEDYISFVQRMSDARYNHHPLPETVRFHLAKWPTLFIGYSLHDYNFRLVFRTLRWGIDKAKTPAAYSVDPQPDPLIVIVWENQKQLVTFLVQDLWSFLPWLYREVMGKDYTA